jgi:hypothetical protein
MRDETHPPTLASHLLLSSPLYLSKSTQTGEKIRPPTATSPNSHTATYREQRTNEKATPCSFRPIGIVRSSRSEPNKSQTRYRLRSLSSPLIRHDKTCAKGHLKRRFKDSEIFRLIPCLLRKSHTTPTPTHLLRNVSMLQLFIAVYFQLCSNVTETRVLCTSPKITKISSTVKKTNHSVDVKAL